MGSVGRVRLSLVLGLVDVDSECSLRPCAMSRQYIGADHRG